MSSFYRKRVGPRQHVFAAALAFLVLIAEEPARSEVEWGSAVAVAFYVQVYPKDLQP
jgi:hypothetical protein